MTDKRFRLIPKDTVAIEYGDGDYEGLRVVCTRKVSAGVMLELINPNDLEQDDEKFRANMDLMRRFGREVLLSWNLDDSDGNPIPATADGILAIPLDLAVDIFNRWSQSLIGVEAPLGPASSNGHTSNSRNSSRSSSRKRRSS